MSLGEKLGYVHYSDEQSTIREYFADPDESNADRQLGSISTTGYLEDSGGISIYEVNDGTGYALVPNQRATKSHIYKREGEPGNPHNHMEVKAVNVSTNNSDGSEITNVPVNSKFPAGLFVAMSDDKTFQYYSWAEIAGNDLVIAPNGVKQAK